MKRLQTALKRLKTARFAVLGVGNELRGDDAAGPVIIKRLAGHTDALVIDGAETPENALPQLKKYNPEAVLIVDAADFGKQPGYAAIINEKDIENASFSTHRLPLSLLIRFLKSEIPGVEVLLIGIQPGQFDFAQPLTPAVADAIDALVMGLTGNCRKPNTPEK